MSGDKTVVLKIRRLQRNANDLEPVWARFGLYLSRQVGRQFASRGSFFGTPWKPLTPRYLLEKRRHGYSSRLLVRSGTLKNSFTARPMRIENYHPLSAQYGSDLDTAVWHQRGTRKDGKQVNPPRPMLVTMPRHRAFLKRIIKQHLAGKDMSNG